MPAINMGSAGGSNAQVANAATKSVLMHAFSGPSGSPLDARKIASWSAGAPVYAADATNYSTGALCTGIGFNGNHILAPGTVKASGLGNFTDDYTPGITMPDGTTAASLAVLTTIGGGKSLANGTPDPYVAQGLLGFGNGASRDAGAGPAFTGFVEKMVTATGAVAEGAAIEAGWINRLGRALVTGESGFGSNNVASAAVT